MSFFEDLLKVAFPLILKGAQSLADSAVDGAALNADQKRLLYAAYVVIEGYFLDLVESTENEYDDETLAVLSAFCADTLNEAGIELPEIPEFE